MNAVASIPVAVLDANVLYPQFLRDLLLRVASAELFDPRWTDRIQQEWMRNLAANRPDLPPENIERARKLMEVGFPQGRVTGYRGIERSLAGVHPKDRHVAAAAVRAGASHIVTFNLRDYPAEALSPYGITPIHPDRFLISLSNRESLLGTLDRHRSGLRKPPMSPETYRATLLRAGLPRVAKLFPAANP